MPDDLTPWLGTTRPSEEIRQRWRQRGLESTFFLAKSVIGFTDLTRDLHGLMCAWIQRPTTRKLGLAPRDHLKSSCWTIADALRLATANPNTRILIINETIQNATHFLNKIRTIVERNALYRWLYPDVIPNFDRVRWMQTELEFKRTEDYPEATIEAIGVGGASTSRHYNVIKEDDLVGKEAQNSRVAMDRAIDQHKLAESLLNHPDDLIQTYGTRWHSADLAQWMLEHEPHLDYLRLACRHPDQHPLAGQPIWPERFTAAYFTDLRRKIGPALFALQYQNEAIAEGLTEFRLDWLRFWHPGADAEGHPAIILERPMAEGGPYTVRLDRLEVFQTIDPGLTETGAARTAIVIAGLTDAAPFDIVLLDAQAARITPKETVVRAAALCDRWRPLVCGVEVVAGQLTFYYWLTSAFPTLPVRRLKTDTHRSKLSRIRQFGPFAEQGRLYVHRDQTDFIEEFSLFPQGRTVDLLDAAAYLPQIWSPPPPVEIIDTDERDTDEREWASEQVDRDPLTGY